ncbi:MAG: hypothetical protein KKB31_06195 [Nanoarchaeota archaeon]|nr:hypothetical protein [Nanoarchaeota archaeon]
MGWIKKLFFKEKKYEMPVPSGIIKLTNVAKDTAGTEDELKIIEFNDGRPKVKYSEEQVEVLREQGIPVLPEDYSDDYQFVSSEGEGGYELKK